MNSFKSFVPILLLSALVLCSLLFGAEHLSLAQLIDLKNQPQFVRIIVLDIRLSRTLLALLCGALLAGAGTLFQGLFQNPLADSGIMGISAGAALGAVLSVFVPPLLSAWFFIQPVSLCAFIGALAAGLLVYLLALPMSGSGRSVHLLLAGTVMATFFSALTSVFLLVKDRELHKMYVWTLGSFNGKGWKELRFILLPSLVSLVLFYFSARPLDMLTGGEKTAQSLGVNIQRTRFLVLCAGCLAAASAVSAVGIIGFVGLIAPHICRTLYGPSHRSLLVHSMLFGAILLLLADILARLIASPAEIPIGIITSLLGVPFFLYILRRGRFAHG